MIFTILKVIGIILLVVLALIPVSYTHLTAADE